MTYRSSKEALSTELLKTGLYEFNANDDVAEVFSGKAATQEGEGKWVVIKGHHELALNAIDSSKAPGFQYARSRGRTL